ncbi:MAG TPA: ATP-binding protein, partial [Alphaproteobacteria bacterium]|nr:ATP-binding protein [Alphaproteobacteria bacterium]
ARLEANKLELDPAPFNLHRLIDEAVELFRAGAAERGLRLEADVPADSPPVVMGDAVRLRQVLFNLVGNAVKFTHRGHVVVRLRHRLAGEGRVQLRIEVEDTGIGIPADQQRRLFQPFTQADAQVSARYGGTGLGLSICRRIVALMGGEIGVESEPGAGSTFQVKLTLPLASLAAAPAEAEAEPAAPLRILAVDDNPANRMLAVAMLSASGHAVEQADSGAAALAAVQDGRFDVVLMDVQMPGMDGVEATRRIRALPPPVGGVPIVALTANAFASQRAAYMEAGMNDCVTKPVDWAVLNAVLLRLVPKPRAREPVLDLEHLRGLERVIGRDRLRELADAFAAECGRLFAELEGQRGDLPVLRRTGHVVKGAAANFGALRLVALATAMEEAKDAESAMPASAALEAALREAMAAFEQAFPAGPAAAP